MSRQDEYINRKISQRSNISDKTSGIRVDPLTNGETYTHNPNEKGMEALSDFGRYMVYRSILAPFLLPLLMNELYNPKNKKLEGEA